MIPFRACSEASPGQCSCLESLGPSSCLGLSHNKWCLSCPCHSAARHAFLPGTPLPPGLGSSHAPGTGTPPLRESPCWLTCCTSKVLHEVYVLACSDLRNLKVIFRMTEDTVGLSESGLGVLFLDTGEHSSCPVQSSVVPGIRKCSNRPLL